MLMHKYGREFSVGVMENKDGCVSERVRSIHCANSYLTILILLLGLGHEETYFPYPS